MRQELATFPRDRALVVVKCSCATCKAAAPHEEVMATMRRSLFCAIVPGDTQSTRRLAEAVLSGCIPVFLGPPYHALPMAATVDYSYFSVFFKMNDTTAWDWGPSEEESLNNNNNNNNNNNLWGLEEDSGHALHAGKEVGSFSEAVELLLATPASRVRALQRALDGARPFFYWGEGGALAEATVAGACAYARRQASMARIQNYRDQIEAIYGPGYATAPGPGPAAEHIGNEGDDAVDGASEDEVEDRTDQRGQTIDESGGRKRGGSHRSGVAGDRGVSEYGRGATHKGRFSGKEEVAPEEGDVLGMLRAHGETTGGVEEGGREEEATQGDDGERHEAEQEDISVAALRRKRRRNVRPR
jgi:hypothetical protein